jgi:transposase
VAPTTNHEDTAIKSNGEVARGRIENAPEGARNRFREEGLIVMKMIGVGIDTARYGHVASFVREDRQPAAPFLQIKENRQGYQQLRQRLEALSADGDVHLLVRIDAGGQYARNLQAFLQDLPLPLTVSVGEPKRNRDYHKALSPKNKSDKSESWALARYAVAERPDESPRLPAEFQALQEIAGRLESKSRETTRSINQLHNLVSRTFPELEFHVSSFSAAYVLKLLAKYPTAAKIAAAQAKSLRRIPHLKEKLAAQIHAAAKESVASFRGEAAEELVKAAVQQVQRNLQAKQKMENLLLRMFRQLPKMGQQYLLTIPGIGEATAAVLTAKIISIDRFETDKKLVSYFGAFPEMRSSGFHKDGTPKEPRMRMSTKGNDLVRGYLWNATCAAVRANPDVRALYRRKRSEGKRGDVAMGHCMRKLLNQVFHVWKTQRPYRPHVPATETAAPATKTAAGPKVVNATNRQEVTAASRKLKHGSASANPTIDYGHLRGQITFREVLAQLGVLPSLHGSSIQMRGPCPLHGSHSKHSRSLSVNLEKNIFRCFAPDCQAQGNVLDFWAQWHRLPLYEAAKDLAHAFQLELTPNREEEPVPSTAKNPGTSPPTPLEN